MIASKLKRFVILMIIILLPIFLVLICNILITISRYFISDTVISTILDFIFSIITVLLGVKLLIVLDELDRKEHEKYLQLRKEYREEIERLKEIKKD